MRTRIIDTKWKILNHGNTNFGISSSDMYQMFAYAKKYSCEQVVMIYPLVESLPNDVNDIRYTDGDVTVHIYFLDCVNGEKNLSIFLKI